MPPPYRPKPVGDFPHSTVWIVLAASREFYGRFDFIDEKSQAAGGMSSALGD
jgi:hypothetical protein